MSGRGQQLAYHVTGAGKRMSFGERLRELRKAKGLTLRDMAAKVGVGFTYLSRVETGRMTTYLEIIPAEN